METKPLHAIIAGIIVAMVLGFSLIPTTWQMISHEPIFGRTPDNMAIIGIIASVAIIAITLLSFKLVRRIEE
ncbi:MAG: hypothetical protein NWF11_02445 [Candidatus Bathyarchaeota archaeon]|nr:hypothetical protein [Candidatus Bathyarchaeota archaeon]